MKALLIFIPDGSYEMKAFALDEERNRVCAYAVFSGTHSGEGGPMPPTGKSTRTDYVLEVHDVEVIRPRALARRRHGTAFAAVRARENRVGADPIPLLIECERLHLVASVRDEDK